MKSVTFYRLALASLLSVGLASVAEAKAGHAQPGPQVFDATSSDTFIPRQASSTTASPSCYIEPEGFHSQIRWDTACRDAQAKARYRTHSGLPDKFDAPRGFKNQIRWD
mgnify:CR=1 FL=1